MPAEIRGSKPPRAFKSIPCKAEFPSSGQSLLQKNPNECGVYERYRESTTMRTPWPSEAVAPWGKKNVIIPILLKIVTGIC